MTTIVCPERETLRLMLLGKLPEEEAAELTEHLLSCDECVRRADSLQAEDELTEALRTEQQHHALNTIPDDVIERARALANIIDTARAEQTDADSPPLKQSDRRPPVDSELLAPPQEPDEIGRLGDYRVLERLGIGGMGIVYRAEDPRLKRQIALKIMLPDVAGNRSARERFLREAQAAAAIDHDNIVPIHFVSEDHDIPFIAMKLLKGESLKSRLRREGRLRQHIAAGIGCQIARGLEAAHSRQLIHRDIKPDNIWIEENSDRLRILDFGLARPLVADAALTSPGIAVGTPLYMAPEQATGGHTDHRCDLFSLGNVLYEVLAGGAPFRRETPEATLLAVTQTEYPPLETACPNIDSALAALVTQLLSHAPSRRPQSAAEVADTLESIESRLLNDEQQRLQHLQDDSTIIDSDAASDGIPRTHSRRWLLGGLTAVMIALAITITFKQGTVEINRSGHDMDNITVTLVSQNDSDHTVILQKENDWSIKAAPGRYTLDLKGGDDQFTLDDDVLTVTRFGTTQVRISFDDTDHRPAKSAAVPRPAGSSDPDGNWQRIDDGDDGYTETSSPNTPGWASSKSPLAAKLAFQRDYRFNKQGAITARWTFSRLDPGMYEVFVTWVADENRSNEVVYYVSDHPDRRDQFIINQREAPDQLESAGCPWTRLTTARSETGRLTIELDAAQSFGGSVVADAVQIRPLLPKEPVDP